jgi:hypothetical protein
MSRKYINLVFALVLLSSIALTRDYVLQFEPTDNLELLDQFSHLFDDIEVEDEEYLDYDEDFDDEETIFNDYYNHYIDDDSEITFEDKDFDSDFEYYHDYDEKDGESYTENLDSIYDGQIGQASDANYFDDDIFESSLRFKMIRNAPNATEDLPLDKDFKLFSEKLCILTAITKETSIFFSQDKNI